MHSFRPLLRLLRSQWVLISLGAVLGLITVLAAIGLLALAGWLICAAAFAGLSTATASAFNYFLPAAGIRYFSIIRIIGRYGERVTTHEATFRVLANLRVWFYNCLEPLAPAHLLRHRSGDVLNRYVSDIDALDNVLLRVISPFVIAMTVIVLVGVVLSFFNVQLAWQLFAVLMIATVVIPCALYTISKKSSQRLIVTTSQLRTHLVETLQSLADVLLMNGASCSLKQLQRHQNALIHTQRRMAFFKGFSMALIGLMTSLAVWLALVVGIPLVQHNQLSGASLGLIVLLLFAAFEAIVPLPIAFQYLGETQCAAERIQQLAEQQPAVIFPKRFSKNIDRPDIVFDQVCFRYHDNAPWVLSDFNCSIPFGEKLALVGPTGCGKTTVMHLLARCWDPTAGAILLGGHDVKQFSEPALRQSMTLISQRPHMFNASVRDNLLIANPNATDEQLFAALKQVQLSELITSLPDGLNSLMGEFGRQFSGGQIRRIAIARAILHDAPIVVLDEPMEGLDSPTAALIWQTLTALFDQRTVIMATHQLQPLDSSLWRIISLNG